LGIEGSEEIGQMLAKTISELEIAKKSNRISEGLDQDLIENLYRDEVMKAFVAARSISQESATKLRTFLGSRITDQFNLFEEIADLPPEFMFTHKEDLEKVFRSFNTYYKTAGNNSSKYWAAYNKAQGAAHEIHVIYKALKSGKDVIAVQTPRAINISGKELKRVFDAEIIVDGKNVLYDAKSWTGNLESVEKYIRNSLSGKATPGDFNGGQLIKDIVYMAQKRDFSLIRWALDSRNADNLVAIRKMVLNGVEQRKDVFRKILGIKKEGWSEFKKELKDGLLEVFEVVPK
jgi:hypothetical protein